ncbi:MAG: extracellular solute-binding protein [Massiliimalia sp.]|jgi:multiple sugar transport system substrate-binding protein
MKKTAAVLLAALLTASTFTACGSGNDSKNSSTGDSSSDGKVTLTLWETANNIDDFYKETVNDFMSKNPDIVLDTVVHEAGDGSELMSAIASGTNPDFCSISYSMVDRFMYANALTDLSDRLEAWDEYDKLNKTMLDMFTLNDKCYGVLKSQYTMALYYNKKLFAEAGLSAPTTWDEWMNCAEKLTDPAKQQYGFALSFAQWPEWWFEMFVWGAGGELTKAEDDGTLSLTFTDPAVIEAAEFYREFKQKQVIQTDYTLQLDDLKKEFALGRAAMIIDGSDAAAMQNYVSAGMNPDDIGIAPIPAGPSGKGPASIGGSVYVIPVNDDEKKVDAAFEYLKYNMSKDVIEKEITNDANNGIKSYVMFGRTDIDISQLFEVPEDVKYTLDYAAQEGNSRRETYGKAVVGTFYGQAVQDIMINDDKDIEETFKKYEEDAMKKEGPDYNQMIKDSKME